MEAPHTIEPSGMLRRVDTPAERLARMRAGLERLNTESAQRAAAAGGGESIRVGLELSELVRRTTTSFDKPLPPSLPALFRRLRLERKP
jgi:hypothetical protein